MSFNIMDLVKDQISDQIMGQMGGLLGDQGSMAKSGIAAAIPALLQGLTGRASVPGGADSLFNAVQDQDDGLLNNLGDMLGGNDSGSMIQAGTNALSGLLGGGGLGTLAGVISGFSGLSKGNTGSLLGMLAPIVFSVLKRKVLGGGMNAGGLLDMLKGQSTNITAAMPQGLGDQLNSSGFLSSITSVGGDAVDSVTSAAAGAVSGVTGAVGDAAGNVTGAIGDTAGNLKDAAGDAIGNVSGAAGDVAAGGSSMFKKLIPIIGLALLAFLGWKMFGGAANDAADSAADAASSAVTATTEAASNAASATAEATSGAASAVAGAMDFDIDSVGTDLTGMFGDAASSLGGITDAESATAAIPGLTDISEKFSGIADKVPEGARGALGPIVAKGLALLEPILEKVRALPGVGALIDPVLGSMVEKMQELAG